MQPFTVALLQMTAAGNDLAANQAKGDDFCRRAAAMGADVALFPGDVERRLYGSDNMGPG